MSGKLLIFILGAMVGAGMVFLMTTKNGKELKSEFKDMLYGVKEKVEEKMN
jgi:gas vesicle protein